MPQKRSPRKGSMQFWPRKRSIKIVARIRTWLGGKEAKPLGFPVYKIAMTHIIATDNKPTSMTKGEDIQIPVTILESPPIKIAAIMLYRKNPYGSRCVGQINAEKVDKELSRKIAIPKKPGKQADTKDITDVRLLVYTQPKLTAIGKKKPELLELGIGGATPEEKLTYAKSILGKELKITDVFSEGQLCDASSITKGKGFQGPVKRFGVKIRVHKSEKTKRGPGSLGPWSSFDGGWRVAKAGQMGFHQRTEYNKYIIKMTDDTDSINPKKGFRRYGLIKNPYLLVKGSIGGASKRLIMLSKPRRPQPKQVEPPKIVHTGTQWN